MNNILTANRPLNWRLARLGQVFDERKQKASDKDYDALSVTMRGIVPQLETAAKSDDGDNRKLVRVGDYIINSRSDRKGSGGISQYDGTVSLINIVLQPRADLIYPRFANHLLRSHAFQEEFYRWGHGIVADLWTTRYSEMKNIQLYLPDFSTQKNIAAFLDQETARIDALIEKNERLISLCEEKTRAVIDSVFSKANSLIPIKYVAHINYDTLSSGSPDDMELRYADLSRVCPRDGIDPEVMTLKDAPSRARRIVHENDVLFASVGPFSKKVLSAKKDDEGAVVSTGFFVMKAKRGHHSRFLEKILQSTHVLSEVEKGAVGAIYSAINDTTFRNIRIPAFSYEEQVKFSEDMEAQISNLSALSEKARRMNALLKEKRSALITAAVTGQIDIPE